MTKITVTANVKLKSSENDTKCLLDTAKAYTKACNAVSDYVFRTRVLIHRVLHDELYDSLRNTYGLKSQMAESVLRTVIARYRSILTNQKKWIHVVFHSYEYDLVWNRDYSLLNEGLCSVNTLQGRIRFGFHTEGMEHFFSGSWKFGTAKLVHKHNSLFLHIPVTMETEAVSLDSITEVIGIDRGIRFLTVTHSSNGKTTFVSGAQIKQKRAQFKALRTQLQKRQTSSARRRLKQIGQRENRWMRDVNHCVSKALTRSHPAGSLFVLEDLSGIRNATERVKRKDRYVTVSWSYYDLEQKIRYKAALRGQTVISADPAYTSQCCPVCHHTDKSNRDKKHHVFKCIRCGYQSNDDRIAAMNLCGMGIKYLAESQKSISLL